MGKNHNMAKSNWVYLDQNFTQNVKALYFLLQTEEQILKWGLQEITVKCILQLCKYVAP